MHPRKVLHDLVVRANAKGYIVVIPAATGMIDQELLEWGFTLQNLSLKDGRHIPVYMRGQTGVSVVNARYEKFGVRVEITDAGVDTGFDIRVQTRGKDRQTSSRLYVSRDEVSFYPLAMQAPESL
jgi:hypothetical protein